MDINSPLLNPPGNLTVLQNFYSIIISSFFSLTIVYSIILWLG